MRRSWILVLLLCGCPAPPALPGGTADPGVTGGSRPDAPLHEIHQVYRIAREVSAQKVGEPDEVSVAGLRAGTVELRRTRWELRRRVSQSAVHGLMLRSRYMKLPPAERAKHMRRLDEYFQIWWIKLADVGGKAVEVKRRLKPTTKFHRLHREVAFLGRDSRFAWYLYAPIQDWVRVQKRLGLGGGDESVSALLRGLGVKDRYDATEVACFYLLSEAGTAALGALESAIAAKHPQRGRAIRAVGRSRAKAITSWLMRLVSSSDPVVAKAARSVLLYPARKEAASLYVKWLAAGAGKRWVNLELAACAAVQAKGAKPILAKVLASPYRVSEYRQAFALSRQLGGNPIPARLLEAEAAIQRAGFAMGTRRPDAARIRREVRAVLRSPDAEAAAVIGLSVALFVSKGDYSAANRAGVDILRRVRNDYGVLLVGHLAKAVKSLGDQQAVQHVATAMKGSF